jgi:hypothetical protein
MDTKTGQATKEHNQCPLEFQWTAGRPDHQQLQRYVYEEFQHLFIFNFRVIVRAGGFIEVFFFLIRGDCG